MNVPTIEVSKQEALIKIEDYKSLNQSQKTREDERLLSLYKAVSNGARVINVANAFKLTGLNEKGQPKLAISRADFKDVWFHPRRALNGFSGTATGAFSPDRWFKSQNTAMGFGLPANTFDNEKLVGGSIHSRVPHIPPGIRPTIHLRNFHILFEVQNWKVYPVDPFLMRRIEGNLFIIVAEWELSELEAMLLGSMTTGN